MPGGRLASTRSPRNQVARSGNDREGATRGSRVRVSRLVRRHDLEAVLPARQRDVGPVARARARASAEWLRVEAAAEGGRRLVRLEAEGRPLIGRRARRAEGDRGLGRGRVLDVGEAGRALATCCPPGRSPRRGTRSSCRRGPRRPGPATGTRSRSRMRAGCRCSSRSCRCLTTDGAAAKPFSRGWLSLAGETGLTTLIAGRPRAPSSPRCRSAQPSTPRCCRRHRGQWRGTSWSSCQGPRRPGRARRTWPPSPGPAGVPVQSAVL